MIYDYTGNEIDLDVRDYDATVRSVNHRGYSLVAPENTLPAYILSKKMGFKYVETDISFTSDNVPVLLHDSTIDRTSDGTGNISDMTFNQVRQYDFGSWKSLEYAGTKIPSLAEFLDLCKSIMLFPYLELKNNGNYTQAQIQQIVEMVNAYGLRGKVTYISFSPTYLGYVKDYDANARLGYLAGTYSSDDIGVCTGLKTATNEVYYGASYSIVTQSVVNVFMAQNIPMETWTINDSGILLSMNKYLSGFTSDVLIAGKVMYNNVMN